MILMQLACDGCGQIATKPAKSAAGAMMLARHQMKKQGWSQTKGTTKDFCPFCTLQRAEAKKPKPE